MKSDLIQMTTIYYCGQESLIRNEGALIVKCPKCSTWMQSKKWQNCCRKGGPLPGTETGLLSNTWKWIVQGHTCADKARDFIGKGRLGGEQEGKGTQKNHSVTWLAVSGFMMMGLVSGLSLANHLTQSPSWCCTPCLAKMNAREKDSGRWSDMWCLLLTFPELFQLVVAY